MLEVTRIRKAGAADGARILDIWRRAVDATHHFLRPQDRKDIDLEVQAFIPGAALDLAVDDGDRPIAFMLVDGNRMEALFVDPGFHGQGVGLLDSGALSPILRVALSEATEHRRMVQPERYLLRMCHGMTVWH